MDHVAEEAKRLLDVSERIPAVQLAEVDGVQREAPQGRVKSGRQVLPGEPWPLGLSFVGNRPLVATATGGTQLTGTGQGRDGQ